MPGGWNLGGGIAWNYKAAAAVTAGRIVNLSADDTVQHSTAGTTHSIGIAMNTLTTAQVTEGRRVDVKLQGPCWCTASAAISRGDPVTATTAGKAVSTTTDGDRAVGVALTAAAADDDKFMVMVGPFDVYVA
jgi:hypothetical protein